MNHMGNLVLIETQEKYEILDIKKQNKGLTYVDRKEKSLVKKNAVYIKNLNQQYNYGEDFNHRIK